MNSKKEGLNKNKQIVPSDISAFNDLEIIHTSCDDDSFRVKVYCRVSTENNDQEIGISTQERQYGHGGDVANE